ncbi:MAG: FkbM family methyltransferase [Lachnospiraceae bacterium]|nr:FkbM family methyltransferase [Lachnospiraceae bacterium]
MEKDFLKIKQLYDILEDNESKWIFENRLLFSLSSNWEYIRRMLLRFKRQDILTVIDILEKVDSFQNKIVVFGAGGCGRTIVNFLEHYGIEIECFSDNDKSKIGQIIEGRPVISVEQLVKRYSKSWIIIGSEIYDDEITDQLINEGFSKKKLIHLKYQDKLQYFDNDIVQPGSDEVFIDGGAYDGRTSEKYIEWAGRQNVKKIYLFEPAIDHFKLCKENIGLQNCGIKIEYYNAGLSNKKGLLKFKYDGEGSRVSLDGESEIPVVPLDEIVKGEKISFIKLDIEGCELDCLMGAEVVIQTCRPVIAVCVYHKPEDIIDIMQYLRSVLTEYRFYLRHYSISAMDTVLYAVPEERWRKQYE